MKNFVIAAGGIAAGVSLYKLGQIIGAIKLTVAMGNSFDKVVPGSKEYLEEKVTDAIIDKVFHKNREYEE